MCNLSEGIYEKGIKKGLNEGIIGAIDMLREAGVDDKTIIEKIMRRFKLSKEEAEDYVLEACTV